MPRAVSVYSTAKITAERLQRVMDHLNAGPDPYGWALRRNDRVVFIEVTTDDMLEMPQELLQPAADILGGWPRSSVTLMYDDTAPDEFEARMAKAVAMAMSELWPVVLDDHTGEVEQIYPPGLNPN